MKKRSSDMSEDMANNYRIMGTNQQIRRSVRVDA